jgi:superfamily I DNA/RNA helicase
MKGVLDEKYARIFVDEAQDFDPIMLDILLNDTSSPKVFVGDPRQQIYEWRGTINAFERLPSDTLVLEFYKTFRIGEPAASTIAKLTQTPMISGIPERSTTLTLNSELDAASDTPYTYLFRTWRCLLTRVQALTEHPTDSFKLWIYDYDRQMPIIERLHTRLLEAGNKRVQTSDFHEDDELPAFLMKLSHEELHTLKTSIEKCRVYNAKQATCRMYTIHSFKGMEDDVIRLAGDVNPTTEANLYYVGLTRGTSAIYADRLDQAKPATQAPAPANPSQAKKRVPLGDQLQSLSPDSKALAEALASFRKDRAANTNKPAYTVFTNKVLLALAEARPADLRNLRAIHGVGEKLVDNIGAELLELVKRHELVQ